MPRSARRVRVVVVDDSSFIRKALSRMLGDDERLEVIGSAASGEELLAHLDAWQPDVVTLDLNMPGMGGLETLDRLMARRPTPVIILSTHSGEGAPLTIEALHRGAVDFIDKQRYSLVDFEALRSILAEKIFQVTGRPQYEEPTVAPEAPAAPVSPPPSAVAVLGAFDVITVGASTGGPPTIERLLRSLSGSVPVPIVVVQHMPVGFTRAFAERLNAYLDHQVREAIHEERLVAGTVYIAPAGQHLRLRRDEAHLCIELGGGPADAPHVPSIDVLFDSAARAAGARAIGILLTGMGRDGAQGLLALRERGAYTLAQDEASSIVFGMPRAAINLHAAYEVLSPEDMGRRLTELVYSRGYDA